jgi:hypothetical protein
VFVFEHCIRVSTYVLADQKGPFSNSKRATNRKMGQHRLPGVGRVPSLWLDLKAAMAGFDLVLPQLFNRFSTIRGHLRRAPT